MKLRIVAFIFLKGFFFAGMLVFLTQCKQKPDSSKVTDGKPKVTIPQQPLIAVPDFNADSAYSYISSQVAFGPRIPGTQAQEKCAAWLTKKLSSYTKEVIVQDIKVELWNNQKVPCKNIIASFNPEVKKRILLCSHWDTRPWSDRDPQDPKKTFDGADDGASGVGILLEIARQMSKENATVGVDILLLDVEDYGPPEWDVTAKSREVDGYCLGTKAWARKPHVENYRAYYGILLDMVGASGATFPQEGISLMYAPRIVKLLWDVANQLGYGSYFVYRKAPGVIDDHNFINSINGTPCIDIINLSTTSAHGFAQHWHTQQDNMSIIDRNTLKAVGQTVLHVVYSEPPGFEE